MAAILIIDDDTAMRHMLRAALEHAGYTVSEGRNGIEGMSLYRSSPTDVVITDVFMPDQDGIETIRQLRDEFPNARILAISGGAVSSTAGTLRDAELLGANATLAKPFTLGALTQAVRELLDT